MTNGTEVYAKKAGRSYAQHLREGDRGPGVNVAYNPMARVNELIRRVDPEVEVRGVKPRAPIIPR